MLNDPSSPFAGVIGLGGLKAEYKTDGRRRWTAVVFGVLFVLAAPVLLLITAFVAYQTYNDSGLYKVADNAILPGIGALVAFVIGVFILLNAWRNWRLSAALYDSGLAYQSRAGVQQINWADVTAVWQNITRHYTNGAYTGTTHVYTVQTNTGQKIILDDRLGNGVEELGKAVQSATAKTLFPRYYTAVQNGQRVDFGPLGLDNHKLYAGKKELVWNEIKAIKINKGQIAVKKDKGWFNWASASVPQVPNFYIFYDLVGRFTNIE